MTGGGYELEPAAPSAPPTRPAAVAESVNCVRCGYDLRGLPVSGRCPECGTIVERSLLGDKLLYSSPEYLATLQRGLSFILNAILVMVINVVLGIVAGAMSMTALMQATSLIGIGVSLALVVGWWLFSEEDPAFVGTDNGSTARRVIRVVVAIELATTIVSAVLQFLPAAAATSASAPLALLAVLVGLGSLAVWAVKFFAAMLYLRWLSPRIPSEFVDRRAGLLMWLCPVLVTVGAILLMLGPLVALVLYWNLLNRVRGEIRAIRLKQARFV